MPIPSLALAIALAAAPAPTPTAPAPAAPPAPDPALVERARLIARAVAGDLTGPSAVGIEPYQAYRDTPRTLGFTAEEVRLESADGTPLRAWFVPPRAGTSGGAPKGTALILHGYASNIGTALAQAGFLADHGWALFLLDARARNFAGRAAEHRGFLREDLADVDAALAALRVRPGVDPTRLVLVGFSWGAAKALLAGAAHPEVRAVVSDAAPLPIHLALPRYQERMPPAVRQDPALRQVFLAELDARFVERLGYPFSEFDVPAAAARIAPRPLLLVHGRDDSIVPVAMAEAIARVARPARLLLGERFGHCQGMRYSPNVYVPAVVSFLDAAVAGQR